MTIDKIESHILRRAAVCAAVLAFWFLAALAIVAAFFAPIIGPLIDSADDEWNDHWRRDWRDILRKIRKVW